MRGGGRLLRGLLQEYREEQAHHVRNSVMFQTATNPGADAAADIATAGDDEAPLQLPGILSHS